MIRTFLRNAGIATPISPELQKGIGLSLLGTYGFSLGNMISSRHQRRGLDILSTHAYAMTYSAVLIAFFSLIQHHSFTIELTSSYLASLLYLAIFSSVIALAAYFSLIGRIGASGAAYSTLLFPVVALTISTFYENYHWHLSAIVGLLLILFGNLVMFSQPGMCNPGLNVYHWVRSHCSAISFRQGHKMHL